MGIVKTSKYEKSTIVGDAPKATNVAGSDEQLLNTLNGSDEGYEFDFGHDRDDHRLKTENGVINVCVSTFLLIAMAIGVFIGLCYLFNKYSGYSFEIFPYKSSYTVAHFNFELRRTFIMLGSFLLGISIMLMIFINATVVGRFRKKYLNKINVYIYDVFMVIFISVIYIILALVYFYILNKLGVDFNTWIKSGVIDGDVNIMIVEIFKYVVVVCTSIFIVINSFMVIGTIHKKNQFVFEEAI